MNDWVVIQSYAPWNGHWNRIRADHPRNQGVIVLMPTCNNCDRWVTNDYVRVFGYNGEVESCSNCTTHAAVEDGAGIPDDVQDANAGDTE